MREQGREVRRILQKLEMCPLTTWEQGYIHALSGMLTAMREKDRHAFINKLETSVSEFERLSKGFGSLSGFSFYDEFTRGFFTAWKDFMGFLISAKGRVKQYPKR
jgi:hypothetical protein